MKVKLEPWAYAPERAHRQDAGLDLRSPEYRKIPPHGSATIDLNVMKDAKAEIDKRGLLPDEKEALYGTPVKKAPPAKKKAEGLTVGALLEQLSSLPPELPVMMGGGPIETITFIREFNARTGETVTEVQIS